MIPNTKDRTLSSSPIAASGQFGISLKDAPFIMSILRDQIYTDKVMAVLREYSANAWDANRSVGNSHVPIKVTIPTTANPTLTIRDFGPGLTPEEIFQVYTQYGASTKRNSDDVVGMLGIGSKSGFAYSDQFIVTSWKNCRKRIYTAVLDKSEAGVINLIHEEGCRSDETGIEISIAVRPDDVTEFQTKARQLFKHFDPQPETNIPLPLPPNGVTKLKNGTFTEERRGENGTHEWCAVMGCIPYRINLNQLKSEFNGGDGIPEYLFKVSGVLYFDIGAVKVSASREELKYTDDTKKLIVDKLFLLVDEFVQSIFAEIENNQLTYWEQRIRAQTLNILRLPIPKKHKFITEASVELKPRPSLFKVLRHGTDTESISVDRASTFVLRDDDRALSGYRLGWESYLVEKLAPETPMEEVEAELKKIIGITGILGIPVEKISQRAWTEPYRAPPKPKKLQFFNKKHLVKTFKLSNPSASYRSPYSNYWEIVEREPEKEDVYILFDKFKTNGFSVYSYLSEDQSLAKALGGTLPTIYGYKSTKAKPFDTKDLEGTEYTVWREEWVKTLLTKKYLKLFNYWEWAHISEYGYDYDLASFPTKKQYEALKKALGARHMIVRMFKNVLDAKRILKPNGRAIKQDVLRAFVDIKERVFKNTPSEHAIAQLKVSEQYPLLHHFNISQLWSSEHTDAWHEYIKLIDKYRSLETSKDK